MEDDVTRQVRGMSDDQLRKRLGEFGMTSVAVTLSTRGLYEKKLIAFLKPAAPQSPINISGLTRPARRMSTRSTSRRSTVGSNSSLTAIEKTNNHSSRRTTMGFSPPVAESTPRRSTMAHPTATSFSSIESISNRQNGSTASLANFSDSEAETEVTAPTSLQTTRLLRHRKSVGKPLPRMPSRQASSIATQNFDGYENGSNGGGLFSLLMPSSSSSSLTKWMPLTILSVIAMFFLVVIGIYCYSRFNFESVRGSPAATIIPGPAVDTEFEATIAKLKKTSLCSDSLTKGDKRDCLSSSEEIKPALIVLREIGLFFESRIVQSYCNDDKTLADPNSISVKELQDHIVFLMVPAEDKFPTFSQHPKELSGEQKVDMVVLRKKNVIKALNSAIILVQKNPALKIQVYKTGEGDSTTTHLRVDPNTFPVKWPVACKIRLALIAAAWKLVIAVIVIAAALAMYRFVNMRKHEATREESLFYDLVEKSMELLQSPDEPKSMAVLHVRDTLISPQERSNPSFMRVWDKVVKFVESTESRIKVESENIDGEPFKTWKWVANPSSPSCDRNNISGGVNPSVLKTGNIEWQGQAFNEQKSDALEGTKRLAVSTKRDNFKAPTSFLKIRQMFDQETAVNSPLRWKKDVQDAILQKCSVNGKLNSHGITHMSIEDKNMNEGLVYLSCKDIESATRVFTALHGWWCEKRLVSVRFLKGHRYFARFPEAQDSSELLNVESNELLVEDDDE